MADNSQLLSKIGTAFEALPDDEKFEKAKAIIAARDATTSPEGKARAAELMKVIAPSMQKAQAKRAQAEEVAPYSSSSKSPGSDWKKMREQVLGFASQFGATPAGSAGYFSTKPVEGMVKGLEGMGIALGTAFKKYGPLGPPVALGKAIYTGGKEAITDIYEGYTQDDMARLGLGEGKLAASVYQVVAMTSPKARANITKGAEGVVDAMVKVLPEGKPRAELIMNKWMELTSADADKAFQHGKNPGLALAEETPFVWKAQALLDSTNNKIQTLRGEVDQLTDAATRSGKTVDLTIPVPDEAGKWQRPQGIAPAERQLPGTVDPTAPMLTGARTTGMRVSNVVEQSLMEDMNRAYTSNNEHLMSQLQTIHDRLTTDPRTGSQRLLARMSPTEVKTLLRALDDEINWAKQRKSPVEDALSKVRHEIGQRFHQALPEVAVRDSRLSDLLEAQPLAQSKVNAVRAGIVSRFKSIFASGTVSDAVMAGSAVALLRTLGVRSWYELVPGLIAARQAWRSTPSSLARAKMWLLIDGALEGRVSGKTLGARVWQEAASAGRPGPGNPPGPPPTGGGPGAPATAPPPSSPSAGGLPGAPPQLGGAQMGIPTGGASAVSPGRPLVTPPGLPPRMEGGVEVKSVPEGVSGSTEPTPQSGAERQAKYRSSEKGRVKEPVKGEAAEIAITKEAKAPGASVQEKLEAMDAGLAALEMKYGQRGQLIAKQIRLLYKGGRIGLDEVLDAVENANQKLSKSPR